MIMPSAQQKFRPSTFCSGTSTCTETLVIDIWQKFRKHGKLKATFRGSNLAKESVSDLYIGPRDTLMLYLDRFWL